MTQQADAPLTRRALRATAPTGELAASAPSTSPAAPAPMTRRALREAERARTAAAPRTALPVPWSAVITPRPAGTTVPTQASRAVPPQVDRAATPPTPAGAPSAESIRTTPPVSTSTAAAATASVEGASTAPVTRRELRLAQERARRKGTGELQVCRPPFAASLVLPAQKVRTSQARAVATRLGAKPLVLVALSASLLFSGVSQVNAEAQVAAQREAAEQARAERVQRVTAARSAAQAAAIARDRREEALAVAEEVVATAEQVKQKSAEVIDAEALASLDRATAELAELLDSAPAVEALSDADRTAEPEVRTDEVEPAAATAVPTPETPSASETPVASETPSDTGTPSAAASAPSTGAEVPSPDAEPAPVAELRSADRASRAAVGGAERAPVPAGTTQDPVRSSVSEDVADLLGTDVAAIEQQLAALDLDTSDKILAAAEEVATLSAEIEATADTLLAELEAQRAAEEAERKAAEEAARKAAEELARKVAVAHGAPNGQIPADVLCGVSFQSGVQLRCDAAAALERLNAAYRADFGRDLRVVSSYRSYSAQVATKRSRGYLAARPGTSNHGHGIAVDFGDFGGVGNFGTANHRWMRENGPAFGWHHPAIMRPGGGGPQEPWHFEFEG